MNNTYKHCVKIEVFDQSIDFIFDTWEEARTFIEALSKNMSCTYFTIGNY